MIESPLSSTRGTTLIELVVGIAIFTLLVALTIASTIDSWDSYFIFRARSQVTFDVFEAGHRLERLLVTATRLPQTVTIDGTLYTADTDTLIAEVPAVGADGQAILGTVDTLVYTVTTDGLVEILTPGGGTRDEHHQIVLGSDFTAVTFVLDTSRHQPLLTVTLTADIPTFRRTLSRTHIQAVGLKNLL